MAYRLIKFKGYFRGITQANPFAQFPPDKTLGFLQGLHGNFLLVRFAKNTGVNIGIAQILETSTDVMETKPILGSFNSSLNSSDTSFLMASNLSGRKDILGTSHCNHQPRDIR